MAADGSIKPVRSGLSLYANLLDPAKKDSAPGTISSAPVVYNQNQGDQSQQDTPAKQQISSAALRFQPTKRPQVSSQKPKSKTPNQRHPPPPTAVSLGEASPDPAAPAIRAPAKTTLADWTADGDDNDVNGFYAGEKRQRGGRKKRKKNKEETHVPQNWDDIYDPSRPNIYEEYKNSDEKFLEIREWKDRLYAHRMARRHSSDSGSGSDGRHRPINNKQFAAPSGLSFAPPKFDDPIPPPPPPSEPATDRTGDDAYARRMQLSQPNTQFQPPSMQTEIPHDQLLPPPPPPPPIASPPNPASSNFHGPPVPPPPRPASPTSAAQPNISRAPVRYNLPAPPPEIPSSEAELMNALEQEGEAPEEDDAPRSLRPGQKGFAERLMSKYGWSKGTGLGASGSGITAPLRVQVEKQKKKPDSEGGGFVGPGGMGKIVGGKKKAGAEGSKAGKFGAMSEVILLRNMIDGMDLDEELGAGDGGLMQEIGQECGEKYGRVERVFIDRSNPTKPPVFVKFTSQLSALRAVNALEGRIFNGNTISASFFDVEKFEAGEYD